MNQRNRLIVIGMRLLLIVSLLAGMLVTPQPAKAGFQSLDWGDGEVYKVFGPNESITIAFGTIDFVTTCELAESDDEIYPASDIYIVRSGFSGETLYDISSSDGKPNTILGLSGGAFASETIGFTSPSGNVRNGKYAVIYDECQNGVFDVGTDFKLDPAFEVVIPANIPNLPSDLFLDVKLHASVKADNIDAALRFLKSWEEIKEAIEKLAPPFNVGKLLKYFFEKYLLSPVIDYVKSQLAKYMPPDPKAIAIKQATNMKLHWIGISADPPDPTFEQLSPLLERPVITPGTNDPVSEAFLEAGSVLSNEAAAAEALLRSLERYQGAQAAGNGDWALIHARAIQEYSRLLAVQIAESKSALGEFKSALQVDTLPYDSVGAELEAIRQRIESQGLTADELREMQNAGLSEADIEAVTTVFTGFEFASFSKNGLLSALNALEANSPDTIASLNTFADGMDSVIFALEADPGVVNLAPFADAGGPYFGVEGTPVNFSALASSTREGSITEYAWDLDGDGAFDDASTANAEFTYSQSFTGLVGVRVTNNYSFADIAYVPINIADANSNPVVSIFEPADHALSVVVGTTQTFNLTSSDPDGDTLAIHWFLDGEQVGEGETFNYQPNADELGIHRLDGVVSDTTATGNPIDVKWLVTVLLPDGDGDLWNTNTDCDDTNPQVNPGMTEIIGNGLDDDCNAATPDAGGMPRAFFNPLPQSGPYNAARYEHGATIAAFSNSSDTDAKKYNLLDDNELSRFSLRVSLPGDSTTVSLAGGETYLIDRVQVSGLNDPEAVRQFEIAVSTTTTDNNAFTTVLTAEAQRVAGIQEFMLPTPVLAKYVRYRLLSNWQGTYSVRTQRLAVMSGQKSTGTTVTFQNLSSDANNDIAAYLWDFGDGTTSTQVSPTHTFPAPGSYPVSLTVTDASGHANTFTITQQIFDTSDADGVVMGTPDTRGTDFWVAFMRNYRGGDIDQGYVHLYISGETATSGRVTIPRLNYMADFQVVPGQITTVILPNYVKLQGEYTRVAGLEDLGIHITAREEVTVYGLNRIEVTTDAFTALPTDVLGTDYLVMGYVSGNAVWSGYSTEYAVVATEDNTQVIITSTATAVSSPRNTSGTYTITMDRGEVHHFVGEDTWITGNDVTGTWVRSDKPVALFGGHVCAFVPSTYLYCDHLVEQIPPVSTWGKQFVTFPLATRTKGDTFRVLASENDTHVQINDAPAITLNFSQYYEVILSDPAHIVADKPILVAQYSNSATWDYATYSDPFMMLVPPYEQFMNQYTVMTPSSGFRVNYISVVVPQAGVGGVKLDGTMIPAGSFTAVGNSGFFGVAVPVNLGTHNLSGTSPFGVFVYGFDGTDSYGYPGGAAVAPVAQAQSLIIQPESANQNVGSQFCATATLLDENDQGLAGVRIDFAVTGVNDQSGSSLTGDGGTAQYCYTSLLPGSDILKAQMSTLQATAQIAWAEVILNQPPVADAGSDQNVDEGMTVMFDGSGSSDPNADLLTYDWDLDDDGSFDDAIGVTASMLFADNGVYSVRLRVSDPGGLSSVDTVAVTVKNVAPVITSLTGPQDPQQSGLSLTLNATFNDPGVADTHTALWIWGDGSTSIGVINGQNVEGIHTYAVGDAYTITLTVADKDGGEDSRSYQYVFCTAGKYFNGTACVNADPGHYVPVGGATVQIPCDFGTYQSNAGSSECIPADAGHYVDSVGATLQQECQPGSYQSNAGATSCNLADAGYYVPISAAIAQTKCPAGYTSEVGATSCTLVDVIAPVASPIQIPDANSDGWNKTDVTVSWNWTDDVGGSGIDSVNCTNTSISSGEGGSITLNAVCKDLAGNMGTASYIVKVDKTVPTIGASALTSPNAADWYNSTVTVRFACADDGSGIPASACPSDQVLSVEGAAVASLARTVIDIAGNVSNTSNTVIVGIDKTAPTVLLVGGPADNGFYNSGSVPAAPVCSAFDALSGLDGACVVSGYSALIGTHTITAVATDLAGNRHSTSITYTVTGLTFRFSGFYRPVDMGGVWNIVKNGATVPLKFEVFSGLTELTDTSIVAQPLTATQSLCSGSPIDDIELLATGATSLRYDPVAGQFIYNWQTPKKPGYCYVVTVTLIDGTSISANFKLK
jgi:PKD repeat protein